MAKTKLEKLNDYFNKRGVRIDATKYNGRVRYKMVATKKFGKSKAGTVLTSASTLTPFENMRKTRFI